MEIETRRPSQPTTCSPSISTSADLCADDDFPKQRVCEARKSAACQLRGGRLEADRVIRRNTRYCRDCGPLVRLEQNAERKRNLRREIGWRRYQDQYSPFLTKADEKMGHREYMRAWRAWRRHRINLGILADEREERSRRNEFIKAVRGLLNGPDVLMAQVNSQSQATRSSREAEIQ